MRRVDWHRFAAILLLAVLGVGIICWLFDALDADGKLDMGDGGILAAAFLSLREVFSKIENIAVGHRPAPGEQGEVG